MYICENQLKMKKEIKIEIPNGYEIDKENSTFENIVFKEIKKELPKSFRELSRIDGYYVNNYSTIGKTTDHSSELSNRNVFATKEQAQASLALAQLSQLREVYRNGWVPNWSDGATKYSITIEKGVVIATYGLVSDKFLSFKEREIRDLFLENFKDLIEQAKPLMS